MCPQFESGRSHQENVNGKRGAPLFFIYTNMSEIQPRIIGTETEFGLIVEGRYGYSSRDIADALPKHLVGANEFLSNGARLYIDFNNQLEYATPECRGISDAVHAEIAGEHIVYETLENLTGPEQLTAFHLFKRVIADNGTTWGYHENYGIERRAFEDPDLKVLLLGHLATRNIFVGAGRWQPDGSDIAAVGPGQKSHDIEQEVCTGTTSHKPLLNLRDEPHAPDHLARLHITSGDPNISPWATWLKLGTTSLVVRLAEEEMLSGELPLFSDSAAVGRAVGADSGLNTSFDLIYGTKMTAANMQEWLISRCEEMAERVALPKDELQVLEAWRQAHDDIKIDPARLVYRADWITRKKLLGGFALRHVDDAERGKKLYMANQAWDMIHPSAGIGIRSRGRMAFPGYDPDQVERFILHPPHNTRAYGRGKLIRNMPRRHRANAEVDWERVSTHDAEYYLLDPLKPEAEKV